MWVEPLSLSKSQVPIRMYVKAIERLSQKWTCFHNFHTWHSLWACNTRPQALWGPRDSKERGFHFASCSFFTANEHCSMAKNYVCLVCKHCNPYFHFQELVQTKLTAEREALELKDGQRGRHRTFLLKSVEFSVFASLAYVSSLKSFISMCFLKNMFTLLRQSPPKAGMEHISSMLSPVLARTTHEVARF